MIADERALGELLGEPAELVRAKVSDRLNDLRRRFVDASPFVLLATASASGSCDVSPRGDPPGFFTHWSKAFVHSQLWAPERAIDRAELPSSGEVHRSLNPSFDADRYDAERAERYACRDGLY